MNCCPGSDTNLPIISSKQHAHNSPAATSSSNKTLVKELSGKILSKAFLNQNAIIDVRAMYNVETANWYAPGVSWRFVSGPET